MCGPAWVSATEAPISTISPFSAGPGTAPRSFGASLRVEGGGSPGQALPGVVGDQGCGLVQEAGGVAVAVGLELLRPARGGADQLRKHRQEPAGHVGVFLELAQDRSGRCLLG